MANEHPKIESEASMTTRLRKDFQRFLETGGYCTPPGRTACALSRAKTLAKFRDLESRRLVRITAEPEEDNYFDVYGEPDSKRERDEIIRQIELHGCWWIVAEWFNGDEWEYADSIGMCVYDRPLDPFCNDYVSDLMSSAIDAWEAHVEDMAAAV